MADPLSKSGRAEEEVDLSWPPRGGGAACSHFPCCDGALAVARETDVELRSLSETFPISVKDFYDRFLSDRDEFWIRLHSSLGGYTQLHCPTWRWSAKRCCLTRRVRFRLTTNLPCGADETEVEQRQRLRLREPHTVIFSMRTVTREVPFGKTFATNSLYTITPLEETGEAVQAQLTIDIWLTWTDRPWLAGMIERTALDGVVAYSRQWLAFTKTMAETTQKAVLRRTESMAEMDLTQQTPLPHQRSAAALESLTPSHRRSGSGPVMSQPRASTPVVSPRRPDSPRELPLVVPDRSLESPADSLATAAPTPSEVIFGAPAPSSSDTSSRATAPPLIRAASSVLDAHPVPDESFHIAQRITAAASNTANTVMVSLIWHSLVAFSLLFLFLAIPSQLYMSIQMESLDVSLDALSARTELLASQTAFLRSMAGTIRDTNDPNGILHELSVLDLLFNRSVWSFFG